MRAAREGAARLNLRLVAKAIAGKLRSGSLVADEFLQYAEALGSLSRDEIIIVGAVYKVWAEHQDLAATNPMEAAKYTDPWVLALRKLTTQGMGEELVAATAARAQGSEPIYGMATPLPSGNGPVGRNSNNFPTNLVYRITPTLVE